MEGEKAEGREKVLGGGEGAEGGGRGEGLRRERVEGEGR